MLVQIADFLFSNEKQKEADSLYKMSLCFNPQNANALYRLGLTRLKRNTAEIGADLIKHAFLFKERDPVLLQEVIHAANESYQEGIRLATTDKRERSEAALKNLEVLAAAFPEMSILIPAIVCLAAAIGRDEMARQWCVKGLSSNMNRGNSILMLRSALYLYGQAKINEELINCVYEKSRELIAEGENIDLCYFSILYKKYYEGKDIISQKLAKKYKAALGESAFLTNNLMNSWHLCRYDDSFFEGLMAYEDIPKFLGPVWHEKTLGNGSGPVILISCDARYLKILGVKILESAHIAGTLKNVHLHVIDATDDSRAIIMDIEAKYGVEIGFSSENTSSVHKESIVHREIGFKKTYYACARFVRLPEFARLYGRPIVEVDTDCLLLGDITAISACNHESDVSFFFDGIKSGPARQFNATFFFLNNRNRAVEYADLLARYIAHFIAFDIPFWGLDQAGLYCVYRYMHRRGIAPTTANVPSWELLRHVFASGADSLDEKISRLDERLESLRASA